MAFVTNNASRTAAEVAQRLCDLGVPARPEEVVTSAQAVASIAADALPRGAAVLVVGGDGLREPLREHGLECVGSLAEAPSAVVQGFDPEIGWSHLAEASYAVAEGLPWFVSNTDLTFPSERGLAPGNGSLVQAVQNATGRTPVVAGKPHPPVFEEAVRRLQARRPIVVGDRVDTDIAGARASGLPSVAVLSGVGDLAQLAVLSESERPTWVGADLGCLHHAHPAVEVDGRMGRCGTAIARYADGVVTLVEPGETITANLRAVLGLAWARLDASDDAETPDVRMDP